MATRVADEDHVDAGLVGHAGARGVVGGDHDERVGAVADLAGADGGNGHLRWLAHREHLLVGPAPLAAGRAETSVRQSPVPTPPESTCPDP